MTHTTLVQALIGILEALQRIISRREKYCYRKVRETSKENLVTCRQTGKTIHKKRAQADGIGF